LQGPVIRSTRAMTSPELVPAKSPPRA